MITFWQEKSLCLHTYRQRCGDVTTSSVFKSNEQNLNQNKLTQSAHCGDPNLLFNKSYSHKHSITYDNVT